MEETSETNHNRLRENRGRTHLYTGEVSVLSSHVDGGVSVLVDFVQRDRLFLHELKQPQQDLLLERHTERRTETCYCIYVNECVCLYMCVCVCVLPVHSGQRSGSDWDVLWCSSALQWPPSHSPSTSHTPDDHSATKTHTVNMFPKGPGGWKSVMALI